MHPRDPKRGLTTKNSVTWRGNLKVYRLYCSPGRGAAYSLCPNAGKVFKKVYSEFLLGGKRLVKGYELNTEGYKKTT